LSPRKRLAKSNTDKRTVPPFIFIPSAPTKDNLFMAEQNSDRPILSCPHLGMLDDPGTSHSFASTLNHCFYAKAPTVPTFEHQEEFCLTAEHTSCPVYQAAKGAPFPGRLVNTARPPAQPRNFNPVYLFVGLGVLLLALVGWVASTMLPLPSNAIALVPSPETSTAPAVLASATSTTMETSATPEAATEIPATPSPEASPALIETPPFETPFKIGDDEFILHRVKSGDVLDHLANDYNTTLEVIQATNYLLSTPILLDSVLLIRPGRVSLDPNSPSFQLYKVADQTITLDRLAGQLGVDLEQLKYYNGCADRCIVARGGWLLIPRHK